MKQATRHDLLQVLLMHCRALAVGLLVSGCAMSTPVSNISKQTSAAPGSAELRSQIERTGSLRVIVTLVTEGQEPASVEIIRSTQERLLAALQGTEHSVLYVYHSAPLLALVVGRDGLDVLLSSPLVRSITPDAPRRTMNPAP